MVQEIITSGIGGSEYLPEFIPSPLEYELSVRPIIVPRYTPKCELENLIVSADIDLPPCLENVTVTTKDQDIPRILTPNQAYELALETVRTFEEKWDAYVQNEARLLSIFDQEEVE